MPQVEFEPMIPLCDRGKTTYVLDLTATVIVFRQNFVFLICCPLVGLFVSEIIRFLQVSILFLCITFLSS
jgi:hypothetical protein